MAVTSYSPPAGEEERAFPPEQDTSVAAQSGVARLGLIGGVILVVCVTVLVLCGQSKSREFLTYLFLGGIAPMLAASLLFMMQAKHRLLVKLALATRLFLVLVLAGFLVLGGFEYANAREFDSIWPFLAVVCGSALAAATVCRPRRLPRFAALYREGRLPLDGLVGKRYRLDEINTALDDLGSGQVMRPLIVLDPHGVSR